MKITTKPTGDSPVTFVTHSCFAVLFFLPSCCVNSLILRSANAKYHYILPFFNKMSEGDLPLLYSCVFWREFIGLVVFFFAVIVWPLSLRSSNNRTIVVMFHLHGENNGLQYEWTNSGHTTTAKKTTKSMNSAKKHRNTSKVSLLYLFYRKKKEKNIMMFSLRRPQYFICHTSCQRWPAQCTLTLRELETLVLEVTTKFLSILWGSNWGTLVYVFMIIFAAPKLILRKRSSSQHFSRKWIAGSLPTC